MNKVMLITALLASLLLVLSVNSQNLAEGQQAMRELMDQVTPVVYIFTK